MTANLYDWSTTSADNDDADTGISWVEGQAPSTVNDSARVMMKRLSDFLYDTGFGITAGGTANALTVTTRCDFATLATGQRVAFKAASTNTTAATLNANTIGTKKLRKLIASGESDLAAGDIVANGRYVATYDSTADSGTGAWLLLTSHDNLSKTGGTMTGVLRTSAGSTSAPGIEIGESTTGFSLSAANVISTSIAGTEYARHSATGLALGTGFDATSSLHVRRTGAGATLAVEGEGTLNAVFRRSDASASSTTLTLRKTRGSIASPANVSQNDSIGTLAWGSVDGSNFSYGSFEATAIDATPSSTSRGARLVLSLGTGSSLTELARWEHATGMSMFGTNVVIDENRNHQLRSYTVATVPAATTAGKMIYVSNEAGGATVAFSNGSNWKRVQDLATIS
jgi:hypothetical protein